MKKTTSFAASTTPNDSIKPAKHARLVLFLLVVLNIINMVDRQLISSFGPAITRDLQLSDTQFGLLTGPMFVTFYAVMGLFVGRLADVIHRPRLIAAGVLVWSALTAFSGSARSFVQMGIARLFVGVGEACLSPAALSMLSDLFPSNRRGTAAGLYYLGVPLGAGASFIVAGVFGPQIGWRNCFYVLGAIGIVLTPLIFFLSDPKRGQFDQHDGAAEQRATSGGVFASMGQVYAVAKESPALAWAMIGAIFMHLPIGGAQHIINWLTRERGFDVAEITTLYGGLFILFGTLGSLIGGWASDWYLSRFKGGRLRFLAIFLLAVTPLMISYRFVAPDSPLFYIGMCAGFLSYTAFYGPVFSTVQDLSPAKLRGISTAILLLMCNLIGLGLGALIAGVLSDTFDAYGVSTPLSYSLLTIDVLSVGTVVSFIIGSIYWERLQK